MSNYNQLKDVLNDIFELNKADLDFGIYRIMNQKRKQVNDFIEKQLPEDIKQALSETQSSDKSELELQIKEFEKNAEKFKFDLSQNEGYNRLKDRLNLAKNTDILEQEVFSHLANFFKRYYKDGDFISMRRYKKDVYAIPYEGEEVKLHWANHDQYYIKSSENFKNYSFKTPDGKIVNFQLKEVSTEQNNNKIQGDAERRFAIFKELPFEEIDGVLNINFVYEPFTKATKQESLLSEALELLTENVPSTFRSVFTLSPTQNNSKRTLLEKHLNDYVSKNSFDYFIHKDLGGFLSRELDFYIKNEVLFLDDINTKQGDFFLAQLSKVKAIKIVAGKIITFLAQIENFQKKLWLKKKFVIRTDYCITLDKIPSLYYPEILQNIAQLAEWKSLFDVDIQTAEQLVFEQFLVLDTKYFDETFKDRLLTELDDLDGQTDGLMLSSENFQALNVLQEKYHEEINVLYYDPPYNTSENSFIYKNLFKHSSWLTMMENRIDKSISLMNDSSILMTAIDDAEQANLVNMVKPKFGDENFVGTIAVEVNPAGQNIRPNTPARSHDYFHIFSKNAEKVSMILRGLSKSEREIYKFSDQKGAYYWDNLRRRGGNSRPKDRPKQYFPLILENKTLRVPLMEWNTKISKWVVIETLNEGEVLIWPIDPKGEERIWRVNPEGAKERLADGEIGILTKAGRAEVTLKSREPDGKKPKTLWYDSKYSATSWGTKLLIDILGTSQTFSYPKSIHLTMDALIHWAQKTSIIFDCFAGSGTSGHATIKINREDGGKRKYILVEMGSYFNTVTKPRIQKVIYSDNWKNGKPQDKAGISQIVKYQVLESYEDTLNNLYLENKAELDFTGKAKEEYVLQYMLELESRDHLFNLQMFRKPFDYQLKVTENNELKPTKVDLVETFNYLIGLYVSKVQRVKDIKVVEGTTRTGIKTLVIWRDLDTTTHDEVEKLLRRFYDSQRTKEFQQIYINGDHHLENLRSEGDSFKIKLIEETFFKKMFNETEL
jgi:adenine-specific DNA-methyltransferase